MARWKLPETGENFDDHLPGATEEEARREIARWQFEGRDDFVWVGPSEEPSAEQGA